MKTCLLSLTRFLVVLTFGFSATGLYAQELSGTWDGSYQCGNNTTGATLEFIDDFTARIDVFANASDTEPTGSQWAEVWRRNDELFLIGTEWIIKPRGFSLIQFKMKAVDSQSYSGNVINRGCKIIEFAKSDISEDNRSVAANQSKMNIPATDFYLTASYECSAKKNGAYWSFLRVDDNTFNVALTTRDFKTPTKSQVYNLEVRKFDNGLQGFDSTGRFGVKLDFSSGADKPDGYFTDRNGFEDKNCTKFGTQSAGSPQAYWDEYFTLSQNDAPQLDDVTDLLYRFRSLPEPSGANQKQINQQRNDQWEVFEEKYMESIPANISSLPVDTAEERDDARKRIASLENPGFEVDVDFAELYAERLSESQLTVEPIYFNNEDNACERANTHSVVRSAEGVEKFVGLSGFDWDADSAGEYTAMLESCAANKKVDPDVAAFAIKTINSYTRRLLQKSELTQELINMVDELSVKPKTLDTLVATDGYTLPSRKTRSMNAGAYDRLIETRLASIREESVKRAEKEIEELFLNMDSAELLRNTDDKCSQLVHAKSGDERNIFVDLVDQCTDGRTRSLKAYLAERTTKAANVQLNETNAESYLIVRGDSELKNLAQEFGLNAELNAYYKNLRNLNTQATRLYVSRLNKLLEEKTEDADNQFVKACEKYSRVSAVGRICSSAGDTISRRTLERQCVDPLDKSQLPEKIQANLVQFGDGVKQHEVPFRDLVCEISRSGVDLIFEQSSNELMMSGFDRSTKTELFNASMVHSEKKPDVWVVEKLDGTVPNTLFGNIDESQLIHCLLTIYGCQ